MAGNLLLLRKATVNEEEWQSCKCDLLKKINATFIEYIPLIRTFISDERILLITFRHDSNDKAFQSSNGDWLVYEGQVFALKEEKKLEAEDIYNLYLLQGDDFANHLDGHFVIKLFDSEKNEYKVVNDYIKNKANFICETDRYVMFTPYAVTAAQICEPKIDLHALNEFMWRYYVMSYKTLMYGVSKLLPATVYSVKDDFLLHKPYWAWPKQFTDRNFEECVDDMAERVKGTARLLSNSYESVSLDFTMGQDSRQNIVGFTNQNLPFSTMTFGKQDFEEVENVKRLAKKYEIDHHTIELEEDYTNNLMWHFKRAVVMGSCEEPGHLLGRILYMRQRQKKYGEVLLNGMDGHFYKNGLWDELYTFNFYQEPKEFSINTFLNLRALSKNYRDEYFTNPLKDIKSQSKEYFAKIAKSSIKGYDDSPISMQVDKFDLLHWLTFALTANSTCNSISNAVSPLLLRRNMELALQIPVQWKFNLSRWQRAFVSKLDKDLAAEKTDFGGVNMIPKTLFTYPIFFTRYFLFQTQRLRKKILSKMGFKVQTHLQEAWDYLPLYHKLMCDPDFTKFCKVPHLISQDIIEKKKWDAYISSFNSETNINEYENLFKIVSVEIILDELKTFSKY